MLFLRKQLIRAIALFCPVLIELPSLDLGETVSLRYKTATY